mgnify:CR=1 FL=1|tara:strand:+ start:112594 stop:113190 length:597 start_codon:yes stop_codon:yes gene_type:complete
MEVSVKALTDDERIDITHVLFGILLGVQIVGILFIFLSEIIWDVSLLLNITISFAAVIAIWIQNSAVKLSKKEREWNICKDILLSLTKAISLVMESNRLFENIYIHELNECEPYTGIVPDITVYRELDAKINEAIDVYSMILDIEIIKELKNLIKELDQTKLALEYGNLNEEESFGIDNRLLSDVHFKLNQVITRYAK